MTLHQRRHSLRRQVVDRKYDLLRLRQIETDRGLRVEGIGVVLGQRERFGSGLVTIFKNRRPCGGDQKCPCLVLRLLTLVGERSFFRLHCHFL